MLMTASLYGGLTRKNFASLSSVDLWAESGTRCNKAGKILGDNASPEMTKNLFGKLFGDRGYISQKLFELLLQQNIQLITTIKKNMKNRLMPLIDKILLRKRSLIETVNDQLKNISQIQHTRHRSEQCVAGVPPVVATALAQR